ncbi:MAG: Type 1 glutamine amidotransferase-like domain-containing protein [Chloroflexota bacterium]
MNGLITLLGSGEYLPVMEPVDRYLLQSLHTNGHAPRVACLPTAAGQEGDESVERWSRMGLEHFQRLGADVSAPRIVDRASADDPRWEATLEAADLVYFSGGKPDYLYRTLRGSRAWAAIQGGWERGAAYAGCSAGAMVLAQRIPNFRAAGLASMPGFGILPAAYVIPHFDRMRGLWSAYLFGVRRQLKDGEFILGVDEDTALVGRLGGDWRVMGRSNVHVITRDAWQEYVPGESVPMPG